MAADRSSQLTRAAARTRALLAAVETSLRDVDDVDDQIGEHARNADAAITRWAAQARKRLDLAGGDTDAESRYVWHLRQRHRARMTAALADHARARRKEG